MPAVLIMAAEDVIERLLHGRPPRAAEGIVVAEACEVVRVVAAAVVVERLTAFGDEV